MTSYSRRKFCGIGALTLFGPFVPRIGSSYPLDVGEMRHPGGSTTDQVAIDWANRVVSNGGTLPSTAYQTAVSDFVTALKSAGIWSKIIFLHGVVPGPTYGINPAAASCYAPNTPILVGPSVNLLNNQAGTNPASNWPSSSQLQIDLNGLNNWTSDIAATSTAIWSSATNIGWSVYVYSNTNNPICGCTNNSVGTDDPAPASGAWSIELGACCGTFTSFTPGFSKGLFSFNRTATNNAKVFGANSTNSPTTLVTNSSTDNNDPRQNTYTFYFHGRNGPAATINGVYQLSLLALHTAFSLTDFSAFYTPAQAFRQAIGGGYV